MNNKKRDISIDIMKGILIISVVVAHSRFTYRRIFYWFHMPLFFIISGCLLKLPEKGAERQWIKRRAEYLLVPYCSFAFVIGLCKLPNGIKEVMKYWLKILYGGKAAPGVYWFVTVLFLSQVLIVYLYQRLNSGKSVLLIAVAMYFTAILESCLLIPPFTIQVPTYTKLPWNMDVCLLAVPYILIGYWVGNHREFLCQKKNGISKFIRIMILTGITMALVLGLYFSNAVQWLILDMKYSQYKNPVLDIIIPIVVGILLFFISNAIKTSRVGYCLAYVGRSSMFIIYVHIIIRDRFVIPIMGNDYSIVLYVVSVIVISSILEKLLLYAPPAVGRFFGVHRAAARSSDSLYSQH